MRDAILKLSFLIVVFLTAGSSSQAQPGQTATIAEALRGAFGSAVEAVALAKPFYLTGDFNGDHAADLIVVVRIKERRNALPKDVHLLDPFGSPTGVTFPKDPAKENKFALAIIHSWKAAQPAGKFLLVGDSPILILENSRPTSGPEAGDMKLMLRNAKRRKGETYPRAARGDVVLMTTEVGGDSQLYWNGKTYRWEDSSED